MIRSKKNGGEGFNLIKKIQLTQHTHTHTQTHMDLFKLNVLQDDGNNNKIIEKSPKKHNSNP